MVLIFGPIPGPLGLTIMLLPEIAKLPPASKNGAPKFTVPVYGDPSLILTEKVATTAPFGVVSGTVGLSGVTVMTGPGAAAVAEAVAVAVEAPQR
jgi:hypothetical protein